MVSGAAQLGESMAVAATSRLILVVEDEPDIARMLKTGLEQSGYRVLVSRSIGDAQLQLRTQPCDMVLCDQRMPGGTGMELLHYVGQLYPHLPFIMLTAYPDTTLAQRAIAQGALDFLQKPIDPRGLARVMAQNWERLEQNRRHTAQKCQRVLEGALHALVAAVDAKDPYTATHSERVTRLALKLGKAVGLPRETLHIVEYAGLLHDVGKIGIPDHVLLKPGPLTSSEWSLIREHPVRSAEIIAQVPELVEVATVARHHHERLDGAGYPDGLRGDAIPYASQIIAVADTYEALTTARAYRPALSSQDARQVLRESWGTQLNPELGEVLEHLDLQH